MKIINHIKQDDVYNEDICNIFMVVFRKTSWVWLNIGKVNDDLMHERGHII